MKGFKKSRKAISPVLAVLMMIAVAIAGSLITYAWVTGYIGFTTEKAGQAIMIQSMSYDADTDVLSVYVQNVGEGVADLDPNGCTYVNGALVILTSGDFDPGTVLAEKGTTTINVPGMDFSAGDKVTIKVTTTLGAFTEMSDYPASP